MSGGRLMGESRLLAALVQQSNVLRIVHARVDAWVFAFRVELAGDLLEQLHVAAQVKAEHGACEVNWGTLSGALTYAGQGRWLIANARYSVLVQPRAPGAKKLADGTFEAGWTIEVKWFAQGSADLDPAMVYPITCDLAVGLGHVHEARLRRIDLAADVMGYDLRDEDAKRFVKRPRARLSEYAFAKEHDEDGNDASAALEKESLKDIGDEKIVRHWVSKITGFTVCPGGMLMARVYDKCAHLQLLKDATRDAEHARWTEGGWDGESPVTRVEFQLRGDVLAEFGIRNPQDPHDPVTKKRFDGVHCAFDRIWRTCLKWLSLRIEDPEVEQRTRWKLDPRWAELENAHFVAPAHETHGRLRVRGGATVEMAFGCVLSVVAQRDLLEVMRLEAPKSEEDAAARVHAHMAELCTRKSAIASTYFIDKLGAFEALRHIAIRQNATRMRLSDPLRPARALAPALALERRKRIDSDWRQRFADAEAFAVA